MKMMMMVRSLDMFEPQKYHLAAAVLFIDKFCITWPEESEEEAPPPKKAAKPAAKPAAKAKPAKEEEDDDEEDDEEDDDGETNLFLGDCSQTCQLLCNSHVSDDLLGT